MPFEDTDEFRLSEHADTKLWRGLRVIRLKEMLEAGGLYFTRADKFDDKEEGRLSKADLRTLKEDLGGLPAAMFEAPARFGVSCWFGMDEEPERLWGEHATGESVALYSTMGNMAAAFAAAELWYHVHIERIRYLDRDSQSTTFTPNDDGSLQFERRHPFLVKGEEFAWEEEVRESTHLLTPQTKTLPDHGVYIRCNLQSLIQAVYVPPGADQTCLDNVTTLLRTYGIAASVHRSRFNS